MSSLEFLFWDIDDFCVSFEAQWEKKLLSCGAIKRKRQKSLCLSEVMTILIAFHHRRAVPSAVQRRGVAPQNHYRNFKHFYPTFRTPTVTLSVSVN